MAESARPLRDDLYQRLCDASADVVRGAGVAGVCLVAGGGRLVLRFGAGPRDGDTLARFASAVAIARTLHPDCEEAAPVHVQDGRHRVYAQPVARDLSLLVFCESRLPPGLAYRLVEAPLEAMREALSVLVAETPEAGNEPSRRRRGDDIFWE